MAHIGYIGLGAMGSRVVKRLLDSGHTITGYNRTRNKAQWLLDVGMRWADSPRAVAEQVDVVFTMVTNTAALEAVTSGTDGLLAGLGPHKIYCDMSTVSPRFIREVAERVAARDAQMAEAPVSGSLPAVEAGTLIVFFGGSTETLERVRPVLAGIEPQQFWKCVGGRSQLIKVRHDSASAVWRWPCVSGGTSSSSPR